MHWIEGQLANQTTRLVWLYVALKIVGVLAAAFAAEQLARFLLRGARRASADRKAPCNGVRLLLIVARLGIELVQIAVFGAVAYILLPLTSPDDFTRAAVLAFVNASVIVSALLAVARASLAPEEPRLRILPMSAETAGYWFVWLRRLDRPCRLWLGFCRRGTAGGTAAAGL